MRYGNDVKFCASPSARSAECACPGVCAERGLWSRIIASTGRSRSSTHSAVRVFGLPDFYHRTWDRRAQQDIAAGDTVVFARYHGLPPSEFSHDDSNQDDDPAAVERR